jgi:serine protease Do
MQSRLYRRIFPLGVDISPVGKDAGSSAGASAGSGAFVARTLDDSPAATADLKAGDVITTVDGANIAGPKELTAKIRALAPGATVQLGVLRNGAGRTVSVKLGAMAFDRQGRIALDMPALIESSKQDLKSVSDQVAEMCQKCKTSIWAVFCH